MRILVVSSYYRPDGGAAAGLYAMLCEGLASRGHQVTVVTGVPHYPTGRVPHSYRRRGATSAEENSVRVMRVPLPSVDRTKLHWRLLQFLVFQLRAVLSARSLDYDILLTHTPALEIFLPYAALGVWRDKPVVYSVHDVYPGVGVRLGIFRHKIVIGLVEWMEKYCLSHAARIRILSTSFETGLRELGVDPDKQRLVYDWVDTGQIEPLSKENPFAIEHGLTGCFTVLFVGNMGYVQGLDSVLQTAEILSAQDDILFVFVGDGAAKAALQAQAGRMGLKNVKFIDYQPGARMPQVLASADVSLVTLKVGAAFEALPSKTFSILASGRPIIASLDPGSDAWDLVERSKSGLTVPPESPEELSQAILTLKSDPKLREHCGKNGRSYAIKYHSPQHAAEAFEAILEEAAAL